jgi:hypothetical protein
MARLRLWLLIAVVLAAVLVLAGCGNKTVVKVNGTPITQEQFFQAMQQGLGLQEEFSAGRQTLEMLILIQLVEKAAKDKNITVSEAELKQAADDRSKAFEQKSGGRTLAEQLQQVGATEADFQNQLKFEILLKKMIVPQTEVETYFSTNKSMFDKPAGVQFLQLGFPTQERAEQAYKEITQKKLALDKYAELYAAESGYSAEKRLMPQTAYKGRSFDPETEKTLFSLKKDEINKPISVSEQSSTAGQPAQTQWVIFQVVKSEPPQTATLANSESAVREVIYQQKAMYGEVKAFLDDLRAKAKLQIVDKRYTPIETDFKKIADEVKKSGEFKPPKQPIGGAAPALPGN